ncbi:electron transport complex, RnfABCDGE type, E subunit [Thermoanaerobacter mathranii subsp. mathranii str. A3]|jgi:electron transport complex protein RnfE|uniref:Ion-translocating oxidoreductase complex subunit E n=3 Tax=Thermoanaerobacter TaxID=1754 RepID=D3T5E2_THEIA|nr:MULTISPECIES: electron transport complex subunit E [Thermoanaerobacter]ADD01443.1 electron transport complex, RnfABCDGE type, E subunit [Thermoanaerobacter italicus Ab9]ADH59956.1 electron transport complex, RnfABCDGE type, E subunit [Thermoanaerobacter mathranii subsp. mathranii str. A3]MDP9751486.1 electron transport complex protein RnfE [Thermoanaerobacter pentosaceus]
MKLSKIFSNGLVKENPIYVQALGMCSVLAVTTSAINGLAMGLAVTAVLVGSNSVVSLLRKVIPDKIRIPAFIVVIATFVTVVEMFMKAYTPALYNALGIFIPLIVVNCIILGRAEAFASKNNLLTSVMDGLGMGAGYTLAVLILGSIREILGSGSLFGIQLFGASFEPALIFIMPPGAFIVLGILIGLFNHARRRKEVSETGTKEEVLDEYIYNID